MSEPANDLTPLVSVIVVNWNGKAIIAGCLDALLEQDTADIGIEILVVDNGSTDGSPALIIERYPTIRMVPLSANLGFTGGVNAGIEVASGEIIILVNNDAIADSRFVAELTNALSREPRAAAVTARILLAHRYSRVPAGTAGALVAANGAAWGVNDDDGDALINSTGNEMTLSGNGRDRDWLVPVRMDHRSAGPVMGFSGGAVALRRSAVAGVGGFDDRLFMYYEDSDLSWRLRRAGWVILYEPSAVVHHEHAASSGTVSDFFLFHNERNRLLVALKNAPIMVIARAFTRTAGSMLAALIRGNLPTVRRKARSLLAALRLAPAFLAERRSIDKRASLSRSEVARSLVHD